jgi:hypothetical protein
MHKLKYLPISIILVISLALAGPLLDVSASPLAQTSPTLGAAGSYSVLGATTVTNTGTTTMPGDLGVWSGSAVTGGPTVGPPGTIHAGDASAQAAQADNTAAFGFIDQGCSDPAYQFGAGVRDLVGANLVPGVYCADAFELSGTLTLSGSGVWIFKSAATLVTSSTANVVGGDPCNVWWRVVSSATLGTGTQLIGSILALTSIDLGTGATLNGRALAQTGAVTMDSNTITGAICLTAPVVPPTAAPSVSGLPDTGGAPIRNESFPWSLAIVGGVSVIALALGVRAYRRTYLPKQ